MKTLTISTGSFDTVNTFQVNVGDGYPVTAKLHKDFKVDGDGIFWALNSGTMLKSVYSEADKAEQLRFKSEEPLKTGDIVIIEGEQYKVRVKGAYSDCAMFDKVI